MAETISAKEWFDKGVIYFENNKLRRSDQSQTKRLGNMAEQGRPAEQHEPPR